MRLESCITSLNAPFKHFSIILTEAVNYYVFAFFPSPQIMLFLSLLFTQPVPVVRGILGHFLIVAYFRRELPFFLIDFFRFWVFSKIIIIKSDCPVLFVSNIEAFLYKNVYNTHPLAAKHW